MRLFNRQDELAFVRISDMPDASAALALLFLTKGLTVVQFEFRLALVEWRFDFTVLFYTFSQVACIDLMMNIGGACCLIKQIPAIPFELEFGPGPSVAFRKR